MVIALVDLAARGSVIPESSTRTRKDRPDNQREQVCPDPVVALIGAQSIGAAIAALAEARPDWSPSKCARYVRRAWDRRVELTERAHVYALIDAAESDQGPFRRRQLTGRDTAGNRAVHNVGVSDG